MNQPIQRPLFSCPGLATDLYQLTMAQAYWAEGMDKTAVFDLFVRDLPPERHFLLAAGLQHAIEALEGFHYDSRELRYLRSLGLFRETFLRYLAGVGFSGSVWALPEGTPVFPGEPLLEVTAPLLEAQLVETFLINQIHLPTLVASKTALLVAAAEGRPVVDFGLRRAHGVEAGVKAARAAYIAGASATSDLLAGQAFGIPVSGTMAHSYVQAHADELEGFRRFAGLYPETVLLVDTFDTRGGVEKVITMAREWGGRFRIRAIRIDSGDLAMLSRQAREMLDQAGLQQVEIFVSGDLDHRQIAELVQGGAPVDGFGVGTHLVVSADAPYLNCAFKLVEYAGIPRMKLSAGKVTLPGRKQVFRRYGNNHCSEDVIALADEHREGRAMLCQVMERGRRLPGALPGLQHVREYCRAQIGTLAPEVLRGEEAYPVSHSRALDDEIRDLSARLSAVGSQSYPETGVQ